MTLRKKIFDNSPAFAKSFWRISKTIISKQISPKYSIIKNPNSVFKKVYKVKDATWEDTYYPECYGHCREQHLSVYSPEEYIYKSPNAIVSNESDVVITEKGVYWDKYNDEEFITWATPSDRNVVWYDNKEIIINQYKKKVFIQGNVLSLLGVWASHWGHCMYQFLPKLFTAGEAGLLSEPIKVLIPETEDSTIMELINSYLKKYPDVEIVFARDNVNYTCETLYFMPTSGSNFNNPNFRLDYPYYISKHVLCKTKKYVVDPIIDKIKDNKPKYDKIFLPRTGRRTASNLIEIRKFFKEKGFVDIEGADLTLEEKADIFYHAKEVVGMYGSGILNLMFCNQVRSMVFINYKMSTDTSLYLQIRDYVSCLINVTGQDETSDYHTSTYYPMDKVIKIYNAHIKH